MCVEISVSESSEGLSEHLWQMHNNHPFSSLPRLVPFLHVLLVLNLHQFLLLSFHLSFHFQRDQSGQRVRVTGAMLTQALQHGDCTEHVRRTLAGVSGLARSMQIALLSLGWLKCGANSFLLFLNTLILRCKEGTTY